MYYMLYRVDSPNYALQRMTQEQNRLEWQWKRNREEKTASSYMKQWHDLARNMKRRPNYSALGR